ncbi:MAG TPA: hypothetical protein VF037_10725 [Gemmatimonadales bacterium]
MRIAGMTIVLVAAFARTLPAQAALDRRFTGGPGDSALVHLERNRVYLAEVVGPAATLEIRHTEPRRDRALVVPLPARSAAGRAVYEVYARDPGVHVVRISGLGPEAAVQVRLGVDSAGQATLVERREKRLSRQWTIGLRAGAGAQSVIALTASDSAGGGASLDGALRFSSARFPVALALGAIAQAAGDDSESVLWFYAEPQLRVVRRGPLELSIIGSIALGNAERITVDPSIYAGGLQVLLGFGSDPGRRGPALHARYLFGSVGNTQVDDQTSHMGIVGLAWTF